MVRQGLSAFSYTAEKTEAPFSIAIVDDDIVLATLATLRGAGLGETKRMVGRVIASQIASASAASVLPRFT